MNRRIFLSVLGWLVLALVLAGLLVVSARQGLEHSLFERLSNSLPAAMDEALVNGDDRPGLMTVMRHQLAADLDGLRIEGWLPWPVLRECSATVDALGPLGEAGAVTSPVDIRWPHEGQVFHVGLTPTCEVAMWSLAGQGLALAGLALALILLLPRPLGDRQRHWYDRLVEGGESHRQARRLTAPLAEGVSREQGQLLAELCQHFDRPFAELRDLALVQPPLDARQRAWFIRGLHLFDFDVARARDIAHGDERLAFDLEEGRARVRGIPLTLAPTPLLHYAWYARKRQEGDGWFANPPSNRPDKREGQALAEFMAEYGGHAKAVNDLREHGLRSKTLDQNRNRIKEELIRVLGDVLAEPYLVVSERERTSARLRYRLALPADHIDLPPDLLAHAPSAPTERSHSV
ncbi:hypothetical protein [Marinobacter mangrovi]|uniref:hypothetical protein n=1 Tax=Marinobacter mangrovi TaxID=2803918 RepID=UPI001932B198|nr:hypothetical protein [Marinobacter mangrovi]